VLRDDVRRGAETALALAMVSRIRFVLAGLLLASCFSTPPSVTPDSGAPDARAIDAMPPDAVTSCTPSTTVCDDATST